MGLDGNLLGIGEQPQLHKMFHKSYPHIHPIVEKAVLLIKSSNNSRKEKSSFIPFFLQIRHPRVLVDNVQVTYLWPSDMPQGWFYIKAGSGDHILYLDSKFPDSLKTKIMVIITVS